MREYTLYLSQEPGAFGQPRKVWMVSDDQALQVGRRLLRNVEGVDIWDSKRRIALLERPRAA